MNKRKVRKYTAELKKSAIQLALRSSSVKVAAKELGIPVPTLTTWVYQFKEGNESLGESPTLQNDTLDPAVAKQLKDNLAKLLEENKQLNKKNRRIRRRASYFKKSRSVFCQGATVKYAFIKENSAHYRVETLCSVLEVSPSGYYQWRKATPSNRTLANTQLDKAIIAIFAENKGRYGVIRITKELRARGQCVGKNRVEKRMRYLNLKAIAKRKWKATTDSKHSLPVAENLLNRDWSTTAPNQKWVTDVTYVWTQEGWLYLATVMDLYSRAVIGWTLYERLETVLISDALQKALWKRKFPVGVLVHSDRGSQYCSHDYQKLLKDNSLICSMSRKGNCWDNSPMESFYHTLK